MPHVCVWQAKRAFCGSAGSGGGERSDMSAVALFLSGLLLGLLLGVPLAIPIVALAMAARKNDR